MSNKGAEGVVDGDDDIRQREWTPFIEYTAYSFATAPPAAVGDLDCLHGLHLSFHELQLLRLEMRPLKRPSRHGVGANGGRGRQRRSRQFRSELLLGDIHTEKRMRDRYRPTALQPYSLFKAKKVRTVAGFAISVSFRRLSVCLLVRRIENEVSIRYKAFKCPCCNANYLKGQLRL